MRIEPTVGPSPSYCDKVNCRTQNCRVICGLGPPIEWCEGTREVCDIECWHYDQNGDVVGPFLEENIGPDVAFNWHTY